MNYLEKIDHAKNLIRECTTNYENVRLACSFGKDSMVLLHIAMQVKPDIDVFVVLTPMKPKETFMYADMMQLKWAIKLERYINEIVEGTPWDDPDTCCKNYKVSQTLIALVGVDAWITGLRNDEGRTREDYQEIEISEDYPIKFNPILSFTEREIWQYIACHDIPVHPWYKRGYRSLGCEPCTNIVDSDQTEREGRWQGTSKCGGECGIHTMHKPKEDEREDDNE